MKRLTSLFQPAALAAALVLPGLSAQAQLVSIKMYLVPVSPTSLTYHQGDTIQFATLIDIAASSTGLSALNVGASVNYDTNVFDITRIAGVADTSAFAPKPTVRLWDIVPPPAYSQTDDGEATFQIGVGHTRQTVQPGNKATTIAPGIYTIGTYSFPVLASAPNGATTILLPTAYRKSGPPASQDFITSTSNVISLLFPLNDKSSLTYYIGVPVPVTVSGTLTLDGISPNAPDQLTTFVFRPADNSGDVTQTLSVPASGNFSLTVPHNTYVLHIKSDKYLAANVTVDATGTTVTPIQVTLPAGDSNNDNRVDIADFGALSAAYGTTIDDGSGSYDANADFNGDGSVDVNDFALLVNNYGLIGDR